MIKVFFCFIFSVFFLLGCHPHSLEDYKKIGESMVKDVALELSKIQSRDDLQKKGSILKKKLRKLTALMIEAADYQRKHEEEEPFYPSHHVYSDKLYYEVLRISEEIDGGKLFLEELQHDILDKLDVDQRKHQKNNYLTERK